MSKTTTTTTPAPRMAVINQEGLFTPGELELLTEADGSYAAFVLKEMSDMVQLIRQGVDQETFDVAMAKLEELNTDHLAASITQLKEIQATRYASKSPYYDGSTVDRDKEGSTGGDAGGGTGGDTGGEAG